MGDESYSDEIRIDSHGRISSQRSYIAVAASILFLTTGIFNLFMAALMLSRVHMQPENGDVLYFPIYSIGAAISLLFGTLFLIFGAAYIGAAVLVWHGGRVCLFIALLIGIIPLLMLIFQLPVDAFFFVGAASESIIVAVSGIMVIIARVVLVAADLITT